MAQIIPFFASHPLFLLLFGWILILNGISFGQMGADKHRAKTGQRRIREKVLFGTAVLGGSLGAILGMLVFRHKTRHLSFVLGMPSILIAQWILLFLLLHKTIPPERLLS